MATKRLLELLHHHQHQKTYKKRTEIATEITKQIEAENQFPHAHYAFDNGVLTLQLTCFIESCGKHLVSEIECSRHIQWRGPVEACRCGWPVVRRHDSPHTFRHIELKGHNGEVKVYWVFTKVVSLKRYGHKRLAIIHEKENLTDSARFLLTDANHWESWRILQTSSYRWASEVFHQFTK